MGKKYYDVTMELRPGMPVYQGDPPPSITEAMSISKGSICNVSQLSFGSHTGTHVDAPKHFYDDGAVIDAMPLECFLGGARVVEVTGKAGITAADLAPLGIGAGEIILLKTDNSKIIKDDRFHPDYAHLTADAAEYLVKAGIRTLGFDYLSVEKFGTGEFPVHYALLGAGVAIIEGLDLSAVPPGIYEISALPIKIKDGNGSPARVVLYG